MRKAAEYYSHVVPHFFQFSKAETGARCRSLERNLHGEPERARGLVEACALVRSKDTL